MELLRLLVGGAQRDGEGRRCAAVVSCADDERAAVGSGDRAGNRKAEACVRADDLQIPLILGRVRRAADPAAGLCRVVHLDDGNGSGTDETEGNDRGLRRVAHSVCNQIVNRAREPAPVRPDVDGFIRKRQRKRVLAGLTEGLGHRIQLLHKSAQLDLLQPHREASLHGGGHLRQIAHQPQQLVKALVEPRHGAADPGVLHLLEHGKKRGRHGKHIRQRRAHGLRDVQERIGRDMRAVPVLVGDIERAVQIAAAGRGCEKVSQPELHAAVLLQHNLRQFHRRVDPTGRCRMVRVGHLPILQENYRLRKCVKQFNLKIRCVLHPKASLGFLKLPHALA